jgi:hypothetical protein
LPVMPPWSRARAMAWETPSITEGTRYSFFRV